MSTVFTVRVAVANANGGDQLVYTVPAGKHLVVRDVVLAGLSPTANYILYEVITGFSPFIVQVSKPSSSWLHFDVRQAVNQGESLRFNSTEAVGQLLVTGYLFDVPIANPL